MLRFAVSEPDLMDAMERWLSSSRASCSYVQSARPDPNPTGSCREAAVKLSGSFRETAPPADQGDGERRGQATDRTAAEVSAAGGDLAAVLSGIEIVTLQPYTVEDIFGDVRRIAAALGVPERGEGVVRQVRGSLHAAKILSQGLRAHVLRVFTVLPWRRQWPIDARVSSDRRAGSSSSN